MDDPRFIVAEISINWPQEGPIMAMRFEALIGDNLDRGYRLLSFAMTSVAVDDGLTETVIAVFEKEAR